MAQEYFPLNRQEVMEKAWKWEQENGPKEMKQSLPASHLPDDIQKVPDDILNWAIECEVTGKPFKIIPQELAYLRKRKFPLPRRHPDQRYAERMKMRTPRQFWARPCDQCGMEIQTTYAPGRPERVYCEQCYLKEIY